MLSMPDSRRMPVVGPRCHELRVRDVRNRVAWRIMYRVDADAVVIAEIFAKKARQTPDEVIANCQLRLSRYDQNRRTK